MGHYHIDYDPIKQRLFIEFGGFFRSAEAGPALAALDQKLAEIPPGFDVMNDVSHFKPALPGVAGGLKQAAEAPKARGRRRSLRVAGRLITGLMQLNREIKGVLDEDTVRYAKTVEEAHRILDGWDEEPCQN